MLGLVLSAPGILRSFQYVSYGESAPAGVVSLSCDGKVPGTDLDLTHWTSNDTPDALYADTSTEIALKLARARLNSGEYAEYDDAMVVNNHYDTDGVLSVFACTNPEEALAHYELMTAGAEAGDFGEWSSDLGVQLDYALSALCTDDEDEGYAAALARVPALLEDFESDSAGAAHAALWRDDWEWLVAAWDAFESGSAPQTLSEGVGRIMLVEQPKGSSAIDCTVLHRALRERGVCGHACSGKACSRVLKATHDAEVPLAVRVREAGPRLGAEARRARDRPARRSGQDRRRAQCAAGWQGGRGRGGVCSDGRRDRRVAGGRRERPERPEDRMDEHVGGGPTAGSDAGARRGGRGRSRGGERLTPSI